MKTLVIYTSQTGFTQRYAQWIAGRTNGDLMELKEAGKQEDGFFAAYDAIVYGGWCMGGKIVKLNWFLEKAADWKDKRLAAFATGASPNDNPEIDEVFGKMLTEEQKKYIRLFYCQGGLNYDKMKILYRLMMKMYISAMKKKKDATEKEKQKAAMIAKSYDVADVRYTDPIVAYLTGENDQSSVR